MYDRWMSSLIQDDDPVGSLARTVLASISEVTSSLLCIHIEREKLIRFGCYIYRASHAVMELQTTEKAPRNAVEVLQSISQKVDCAKDLVSKFGSETSLVSDPEVRHIISQLEELINHIGQDLSSIPPSTFEDQNYARVAVRSLSEEMKHARLHGTESEKPGEVKNLQKQTEQVQPEMDLYSVDFDASVISPKFANASYSSGIFGSGSSSSTKPRSMNRTSTSQELSDQFIEPMYGAFYCPLSKKIMEDPVTIETGVTYEKEAIEEWLNKFEDSGDAFCPTTGKKLISRVLNTNMALKTTIEEWKDRNEAGRIRMARAALYLASSSTMVLEAIKDLRELCERKPYNRIQVCNTGMLPLLVKLLAYKDISVRTASLDLLRLLADDDIDGKEMIANAMDVSILIKMLSSSHQPTRHAAVLLLLELSKSRPLCQTIGSVNGAILVLITNKYNSTDSFVAEKADEILRNLENHPNNVKHMAENGYVEPMVNHLTEGSEEIKQEMATYLGEIYLGYDSQTYVAERAVSSLLMMMQSDDGLTRRAGFKALARISTYHLNSKVMVESGVVPFLTEEIFNHHISDDTINLKAEAASVLANVIDSGLDLEQIKVNSHGHTLASDYVVYNIVSMLKSTTADELNTNLLKILLCMTKSEKLMATIVSVLREGEGSYTVIELINNPDEELSLAAIKLLLTLSSRMGHMLSERLCNTKGLPENLIRIGPSMNSQVTEKQAMSVKFLAELPHQNLTLNVAILNNGLVPEVLHKIEHVHLLRSSKYGNTYLEGLVGILVRFTTTLYDPQIIILAINYKFTNVLTDLLTRTSSVEVQRLSAIGLDNLSAQSMNLSKPPQLVKEPKLMKVISLAKSLSLSSSTRKAKLPVCPVHRGVCSSQNTFCLIDAKAVEKLLICLQQENADVVEAALSALCTLLDDKVDVDKSLDVLIGANALQHVLNVVKDHREERVWRKSFWIIEKFLTREGDSNCSPASLITSQDRMLHAALVTALHKGNTNTKQVAQRILRHLNKMPHDSSSMYITPMHK